MPKIIENVREQLLAEARAQILQRGYANTTIRSVAGACGLGVGTVYNYFSSKEMLIATAVFEDWKKHLSDMHTLPVDHPRTLLEGIYHSLQHFAKEHQVLFSDADAAKLVSVGSSGRHKMLREQIAALVRPVCESDFCAQFVAESLICWSMEHADFDTVFPLLEKIIKK